MMPALVPGGSHVVLACKADLVIRAVTSFLGERESREHFASISTSALTCVQEEWMAISKRAHVSADVLMEAKCANMRAGGVDGNIETGANRCGGPACNRARPRKESAARQRSGDRVVSESPGGGHGPVPGADQASGPGPGRAH